MKTYLVTGYTKIEVETLVEAESEEDAMEKVIDRDLSICIHGTSMTDGDPSDTDWVYKDAPDMVDPDIAEEFSQ